MPAHLKPGINWPVIEEEIKKGKAFRQIGRDHGISHVAVSKHAKKLGIEKITLPKSKKALAKKDQSSQMPAKQKQTNQLEQILNYIANSGVSPSNAAAICEVSPATLSRWRKDSEVADQIVLAQKAYYGKIEKNVTDRANAGDLRANLAILEHARDEETKSHWQAINPANQKPAISITLNVPSPRMQELPIVIDHEDIKE